MVCNGSPFGVLPLCTFVLWRLVLFFGSDLLGAVSMYDNCLFLDGVDRACR